MPQTGDGGLWPTTDDDTSSSQAKDTETHELPVPDQQKRSEEATSSDGGWFDAPGRGAEEDDAAADGERDEPHAETGQQTTQPVTWPVAELGRQNAPETTADEKTAFVERPGKDAPAWPGAEAEPKADEEREQTRQEEPATGAAQSDGGDPEPATPPQPRRENPATSFAPLVGPARREDQQAGRQENPPSFLRRDNGEAATSFIRRDTFSRQEPADQPTAFIRRDQPGFPRNTDPSAGTPARPQQERRSEWPPPEPPRAAPQRVGPPPEPAPAEAAEAPRGNRKPLLIAAISIVAVIAVAAGVVFGVPGLSDKLGITGEDPVAIDPPPAPISYTPALQGPDAATPGPTRQGVEQALAGLMADPALGNVNGIVIDPATGEALYEKNPDSAITPASTGKILTAAATLLSLDPTEQLVTKVVAGEQPGEVIIVGGGDPTISSLEVGQESIYPGAAHLSELVDQVKAAGVPVQTVYIDQSRYAPPGLAPSWLPADVGAGYIAPIVPAMLDGDRQGDPTENYVARTTDPGRTLVAEFANRIGAAPAGSIEKKAPAGAEVLGEIRSAPVTQLVDNMLNRSENTLADVLAHEVAIKEGEEPSFDGASKAMLDVLRENGFDVEGVVLRDGSGMSEENKMTARLLAEVLAVAASPDGKDPRTAKLRPLLGGLPVAGGSGTLADRYTEAAAVAGKGWVRAKTGSLTGINSLAGIVLDKDNRPLVFAFLTSGSVATSARPALDGVTAALRGCGCQ